MATELEAELDDELDGALLASGGKNSLGAQHSLLSVREIDEFY